MKKFFSYIKEAFRYGMIDTFRLCLNKEKFCETMRYRKENKLAYDIYLSIKLIYLIFMSSITGIFILSFLLFFLSPIGLILIPFTSLMFNQLLLFSGITFLTGLIFLFTTVSIVNFLNHLVRKKFNITIEEYTEEIKKMKEECSDEIENEILIQIEKD